MTLMPLKMTILKVWIYPHLELVPDDEKIEKTNRMKKISFDLCSLIDFHINSSYSSRSNLFKTSDSDETSWIMSNLSLVTSYLIYNKVTK